MKQRMDEISAGTARAVGPLPSRTLDTLLPVHCASKTNHLPEKFATAAVNGEYVDFSDVAFGGPDRYCQASTKAPCGLFQCLVPSLDQIRNGNCIVATRALVGTGSISRTDPACQQKVSLAFRVHV